MDFSNLSTDPHAGVSAPLPSAVLTSPETAMHGGTNFIHLLSTSTNPHTAVQHSPPHGWRPPANGLCQTRPDHFAAVHVSSPCGSLPSLPEEGFLHNATGHHGSQFAEPVPKGMRGLSSAGASGLCCDGSQSAFVGASPLSQQGCQTPDDVICAFQDMTMDGTCHGTYVGSHQPSGMWDKQLRIPPRQAHHKPTYLPG